MMHEPLLCEEALDLLEPSLDGELTAEEEARLRGHLAGCRSCAGEMALAARIQRELRALAPARPGSVLPFPRPAAPRFRRPARIAAAAALLACAVGGALFLETVRVRPATPAPPDPAEVARATAEARYALAYIGKVSRHTALDLRAGLRLRRAPLADTDEP
jgi:anti-sigma factor RsiW